MKDFPKEIVFLSDGNEARLLEVIPEKKITVAKYQYTKSKTKLNYFLTTTLDNLNRLLNDGMIKTGK